MSPASERMGSSAPRWPACRRRADAKKSVRPQVSAAFVLRRRSEEVPTILAVSLDTRVSGLSGWSWS
eukprot:7670415-Alexandrium_andersonii.AAC.1